jgi:hypothetical protein
MAKIIGRLKDIGIGKEGSRGAGVLPSHWIPKSNITFDDKALKARSTVNYGNINLEGNQALVARKHAEGSIEFDLFDDSFGLFLLNIFGAVQSGSVVDSSYTHEFTLQNDSQHQSLAIGVKEAGINDLMYRLAMINSLTITVIPDDVVKVSADFMARTSAVASIIGPSYSASNKFAGRHLTFKAETLTSGLDAGSNIPLKSLEITIEKNLRLDHNTSTVEPNDILNQGFRISGTVELDYENRTYRDLMLDGSYRAVRIDLENLQATIGAGATNPLFRLDLSRVDFEGWEPQHPNDEISTQSIQFMAMWDITNNDVVNLCRLINGTSSY